MAINTMEMRTIAIGVLPRAKSVAVIEDEEAGQVRGEGRGDEAQLVGQRQGVIAGVQVKRPAVRSSGRTPPAPLPLERS